MATTRKHSTHLKISIRLTICANDDAPVGPRLHRDGKPFPRHQYTYDDTPEGRALAEHDMERIKQYVNDYEQSSASRKRSR
jgi:hypothetical protein